MRQSGRLLEWLRDPLVLSWTMAGIFTAVMLFLIIPRGREEQGELILETPAWQPDTNLTQTARDEEPASDSDVPVGPILLDPEPIESSGGEQPETQVSESARPPVMAERPAQPFATVQPVVAVRPISVETEVKVPITSEPPEFDIAAALKQPLRRYELSTPVPLEDLLPELEELVGAPIYGDAETIPDLADRLAKRVKLQLDDTTVGDVLRALLRQADLEMEIQANSLQFRAVTSENEGLQP